MSFHSEPPQQCSLYVR